MDDLVKRLRDAYPATQDMQHTLLGDLMDEAAARIEELERDLDAMTQRWVDACKRSGGATIRADLHAALLADRDRLAGEVEALRRENERLRSLVFVGYQEGYTEAGGHWRSDSGWNDSETKFALDNPPPRAALQGEGK